MPSKTQEICCKHKDTKWNDEICKECHLKFICEKLQARINFQCESHKILDESI